MKTITYSARDIDHFASILRLCARPKGANAAELATALHTDKDRISAALNDLLRRGCLRHAGARRHESSKRTTCVYAIPADVCVVLSGCTERFVAQASLPAQTAIPAPTAAPTAAPSAAPSVPTPADFDLRALLLELARGWSPKACHAALLAGSRVRP